MIPRRRFLARLASFLAALPVVGVAFKPKPSMLPYGWEWLRTSASGMTVLDSYRMPVYVNRRLPLPPDIVAIMERRIDDGEKVRLLYAPAECFHATS